jgi:hypothetical protein
VLSQNEWRWGFPGFYEYRPIGRRDSFRAARFPIICHSALPPFLFPGARQVRSRGKKILVGLGNGGVTKFVCVPRAPPYHRKGCSCSFHGCIKASARFPGSFCAKSRIKKHVAPSAVHGGPLSPQGGTAWRGGHSCLSAGPAVVGTPHDPCGHWQLTDAPCCGLLHGLMPVLF